MPRQPARRLALDRRLERKPHQGRFFTDPGIELGLRQHLVVERNGRAHCHPA
jgi:hypothetical protein